jgi:hypothetical protein
MIRTAIALAVIAAACHSDANAVSQPVLSDLSTSLDAVRAEFNAHASEPRFVTLLSAT